VTDAGRGGWSDPQEGGASSRPEPVTAPMFGTAPEWSAAPSAGASVEPGVPEDAPVKPPRAPTAALGWMALGIAVLFAIAEIVAVVLAVQRSWETATLIAQASNLGTAIAFIAGLFALRHRPSRRLGITAMVLAVIANPFILTHLLAFLGG
jgi:hypothetical protein